MPAFSRTMAPIVEWLPSLSMPWLLGPPIAVHPPSSISMANCREASQRDTLPQKPLWCSLSWRSECHCLLHNPILPWWWQHWEQCHQWWHSFFHPQCYNCQVQLSLCTKTPSSSMPICHNARPIRCTIIEATATAVLSSIKSWALSTTSKNSVAVHSIWSVSSPMIGKLRGVMHSIFQPATCCGRVGDLLQWLLQQQCSCWNWSRAGISVLSLRLHKFV